MNRRAILVPAVLALVALALGAGCARRQRAMPRAARRAPPPPVALRKPPTPPDPLARPARVVFDRTPLPEAIGLLEAKHGLRVSISPTVPVEEWQGVRLCVFMPQGTRRALLDWLVRPLRAHYSIEADGGVWVSRSEDLLANEPLVLRTYRVPTHIMSAVPLRGALAFEREQAAILDTLQSSLRYLLDRRPGCTLAFHGGQDVLVARLPARGHRRLAELLQAMRFGGPPMTVTSPTRDDLASRLASHLEWEAPALPAPRAIATLAQKAGVNIGCEAACLGEKAVAITPGGHTVRQVLEAIVRQTPVGRYALEPGHGIWLYPEGVKENFPLCGASRWDSATVRAYEVRRLLRHLAPKALLSKLKKQVDPGEWERGLPAASVFLPTARLIVVHEPAGHRRVAAVLAEMARQFARQAPVATR